MIFNGSQISKKPYALKVFCEYGSFEVNTTYKDRHTLSEQMIDMYEHVEWECPVAKQLGQKVAFATPETFEQYKTRTSMNLPLPKGAVCSRGEGIVWRIQVSTPSGVDKVFRIKTRGDESRTSHVATEAAVDIERLTSIDDFVTKALSGTRMMQGIKQLFGNEEPSNSWFAKMGKFKQWVVHDVKKEDMDAFPKALIDDYIGTNGLEAQRQVEKDLNRRISDKAQEWFRVFIEMGSE